MSKAQSRIAGIDLIKILAAFFVVWLHSFYNTGYYSYSITNSNAELPAIAARWLSYSCVALFMICTGYLTKNKTLSKQYYLGLLPVLFVYLIASCICVIFRSKFLDTNFTFPGFIKGMFMFTNAPYAWYVEYYICIFLLIPFLNLIWSGLKSRKEHLLLLLTVLTLTIASETFYIGTTNEFRVFPGFFLRAYPFAYHFIGCYLREYPPKKKALSKTFGLAMLVGGLAWLTLTTFRESIENVDNNYVFFSKHYNDYGAFPVCLVASGIFLLLFDLRSPHPIVSTILKTLGSATLGCFLMSYVFDQIFYKAFNLKYPLAERIHHVAPEVFKIFFCSILSGLILQYLYNGLVIGVHRINEAADAMEAKELAEAAAKQAETESSEES